MLTPTPALCHYCKLVTFDAGRCHEENSNKNFGRKDVYPRLAALAASASLGCGMCHLLRECIQIKMPLWATSMKITLPPGDFDIDIMWLTYTMENDTLQEGQKIDRDGPYRVTFFAAASAFRGHVPLSFDVTADEGKSLFAVVCTYQAWLIQRVQKTSPRRTVL